MRLTLLFDTHSHHRQLHLSAGDVLIHAGDITACSTKKELRPRYRVFGHIHASYGRVELEGSTFVNVSIMDTLLGLVNAPVVISL